MAPFIRVLIDYLQAELRREQTRAEAKRIIHSFVKSMKVKVDTGPAVRHLERTQRNIRYATAIALTKTAKRLQAMAESEVGRVFAQPTSFVRKGFYVKPATVDRPIAIVGIKDKQAKVLLPHITGGRRPQKLFEQRLANDDAKASGYWVPGQGIKLNASGNLTKGQIKQIVAGLSRSGKFSDLFVGKPRGMPNAPFGIWARNVKGRGRKAESALVPLLIRIEQPSYRKRFDFYDIAEKHAQRIFTEEFNRAFRSRP